MTILVRPRQREILDAQLARCRRVDNSFAHGAVAALGWLIAGGPGPLTGAIAARHDFGAIVHELAAAEAIIYGPPSIGREYALGVEHALLWAENATPAPPVPAEQKIQPAERGEDRNPSALDAGPPLIGMYRRVSPGAGGRSEAIAATTRRAGTCR
jgi:hypothetical protein